MTKEKEVYYANKYKKSAKVACIILIILMMIIAVGFISIGVMFLTYNQSYPIVIISILMMLAGLFDILLSIKFYFFTKNRLKRIKDDEAARRYCKIHGFHE